MILYQFFLSGPATPATTPTPDATGAPAWWWVALELTRRRRRKKLLEVAATKEGEPEKVIPKPGKRRKQPPDPSRLIQPRKINPPASNPPVRMSRLARLEDAVLFGLPCDDPFLDAIAADVGTEGDEVERMTRAHVMLSRLTDGQI